MEGPLRKSNFEPYVSDPHQGMSWVSASHVSAETTEGRGIGNTSEDNTHATSQDHTSEEMYHHPLYSQRHIQLGALCSDLQEVPGLRIQVFLCVCGCVCRALPWNSGSAKKNWRGSWRDECLRRTGTRRRRSGGHGRTPSGRQEIDES